MPDERLKRTRKAYAGSDCPYCGALAKCSHVVWTAKSLDEPIPMHVLASIERTLRQTGGEQPVIEQRDLIGDAIL